MTFHFGVSVSDFIAKIKLIVAAIEAHSNTHGARRDYAEVTESLNSVARAVKTVSDLQLDTDAHKEGLIRTIEPCQRCIENFLTNTAKFKILGEGNRSQERWKTSLRKIQWAICKKEDVRKFRAEIETHVRALEMLLITFQVYEYSLPSKYSNTTCSETSMRISSRTKKMHNSIDIIEAGVRNLHLNQQKFAGDIQCANKAHQVRLEDTKKHITSLKSALGMQSNILFEFQEQLKRQVQGRSKRISCPLSLSPCADTMFLGAYPSTTSIRCSAFCRAASTKPADSSSS
jgi:hypothetical protein